MAILHYTIGFPPERNGGSVQYAYGLITEQAKTEKIYALVCGDTLFRGNVCRIKKKGLIKNIEVFKLTNPITPTLIYGIRNPASQLRNVKIDNNNIRDFIREKGISVLHLHTLMGIHIDIIKFIRSLGVKIAYTSHDFYGICPHYDLINNNGNLCLKTSPVGCTICNYNEPSDTFLRIANSYLYQSLKRLKLFRSFNKNKVSRGKEFTSGKSDITSDKIEEYRKLLDYYKDLFSLIDKFHFNSTQTKEVFRNFFPNATGKVIPVITSGIRDQRKPLSLSKNIRFGFVGSAKDYKGFPLLKRVVSDLFFEGYENLRLYAYTGNNIGIDVDCTLIKYMPPYNYANISDILYGLDCIIVPSKCYETFSLVTIEALAHGRPVIVSSHVGAKDIINKYSPELIFSSEDELKEILKSILDNPKLLLQVNSKILDSKWNYNLPNHAKEIIQFYNE